MLTFYAARDKKLSIVPFDDVMPTDAVWIDLFNPTPEEDILVEHSLGISIPTHEDMQEIETSSRLYREDGAVFMTAIVLCGTQNNMAEMGPITFILAGHRLVTVRYSAPKSFSIFSERIQKSFDPFINGEHVLTGLLDTIIDRVADALERMSNEANKISADIFQRQKNDKPKNFTAVLQNIAALGDMNSKLRESLVSLGRVITYCDSNITPETIPDPNFKAELNVLEQDIHALQDHASFLSSKTSFLLEATLGMVNIEQNAIIKFFSVVAVVLMPPTLVASVYGMNFLHMPELSWHAGYPIALALMLISAALPYMYFKKRGWF